MEKQADNQKSGGIIPEDGGCRRTQSGSVDSEQIHNETVQKSSGLDGLTPVFENKGAKPDGSIDIEKLADQLKHHQKVEVQKAGKTCYLITPLAASFPEDPDADYIGVDAGFQHIVNAGCPLLFAVGDFDSMEEGDIPDHSWILPIAKDETDSEMAMKAAAALGYETIILWGGLSGRLDHTLANLRLMAWQYPQVTLMDERQQARVLLEGEHFIAPDYPHLSLFALEPSVISEKNVAFELDHKAIDQKDIFTTSNSFRDGPAHITVHSGRVLCILSRYR